MRNTYKAGTLALQCLCIITRKADDVFFSLFGVYFGIQKWELWVWGTDLVGSSGGERVKGVN